MRGDYLYPVLIEDFDYNYDLPNKWSFKCTSLDHDDLEGTNEPGTWYGDAYYDLDSPWPHTIANKNLKLENGIGLFKFIPGEVYRGVDKYVATSANIQSLSSFRTGVFEARIKLPTANKLWPAFWLLNNKFGEYTEIDIFEFYDNDVTSDNCDTYDLMRMTLHTGSTSVPYEKKCSRGDKFQININEWHTYKLYWDDYNIEIYVDGILRGYATKYFEGISTDLFHCGKGDPGNSFDPRRNFDCKELSNLSDNALPSVNWGPRPKWLPNFVPWPPPQPYLENKVDVQFGFPNKHNSMNLILGNQMNRMSYLEKFADEFKNFNLNEMIMEVDWIQVYQPFCCGINKTICSLSDLENQTYNTDILTGKNIQIGYPNQTCKFAQNKPNPSNYNDIPVILLATDEIAIFSEAIFPGGTYAEMRITDCGNASKMYYGDDNYNSDINTLSEDDKSQKQTDSIANWYYKETIDSLKNKYAKGDIYEIIIAPSPVSDEINILTHEFVYNAIKSLYLIDINGRQTQLQKGYSINISNYKSGSYILKVELDDGNIVYKKILKL